LHLWHLSAHSRRLFLASSLRSRRRGLSAQCVLRPRYTRHFSGLFFCPNGAPAQCSCQEAGASRSQHRLSSFLLHGANYGSRRRLVRLNGAAPASPPLPLLLLLAPKLSLRSVLLPSLPPLSPPPLSLPPQSPPPLSLPLLLAPKPSPRSVLVDGVATKKCNLQNKSDWLSVLLRNPVVII